MITEESLVRIVGLGQVSRDAATLESYAKDMSFVSTIKPAFVVKPQTADAVQELIKLANETKTPLVPVSSGAPHFRGDTVPSVGGAVIIDLSGMKKIFTVDRQRRVAMVEPGVTFGELIPAAQMEGIRLNMPLLPRKSKTIVGSLLEREPVLMPGYQWDISDPVACLGLIWGNGEAFKTGQAAGPGTLEQQWAVGSMQKAPYGPGIGSWHRLIQGAQGTMGIVTWTSMRCELLPSMEEPFVVGSNNLDELTEMASWLVRYRIVAECFILNNTNMAAIFAKNGCQDYQKLKAALPAWILFYNLPGYDYYPQDRVNAGIKTINDLTRRLGVDVAKSTGGISAVEILKTIQKPSDEPYWKQRYKGAFQDIFFLTINEKIKEQIGTMNGLAEKAGYSASDIGVYIQPIVQGTSIHCEFNLFYDPDNSKERNQIKALNESAIKTLMNHGAFFSRPYGEISEYILNRDAGTKSVLIKMKDLFDPNNIMNPGKICF